MNLIKRWWGALRSRLPAWLIRRPAPLITVRVEELPDVLDANSVYVVGEGNHLWFAALVCPCGCGETLHMSLLPEGHPRWTFIEHRNGTASLDPSVWRTRGCRSHFWLYQGIIYWS
jgi:hypothetical protein